MRGTWLAASLFAAIVLFFALSFSMTGSIFAWSEEEMTYPARAWRGVAAERQNDHPSATLVRSCADPQASGSLIHGVRPLLSWCMSGRQWPLMVTSYISGIWYWPLGAAFTVLPDDLLIRRRVALVWGLLALVLSALLVRRWAGPGAAAVCAAMFASSICVLTVTSMMSPFEVTPWIFFCAALLVLAGGGTSERSNASRSETPGSERQSEPSAIRVVLAGLLLGVALSCNIKAAFFAVPAAALAGWNRRRATRRLAPRHGVLLCLATAPGLIPNLFFVRGGGSADLRREWVRRLGYLTQHANIQHLAGGAMKLVAFWVDPVQMYVLGAFSAEKPFWFARVETGVAVLAWVYCTWELARAVLRRPGIRMLPAFCGAWLMTYWLATALLYDEELTNGTTVYAVFVLAEALFVWWLGGLAARHAAADRRPRVQAATAGALAVLFTLGSVAHLRVDTASLRSIPFNLENQRQFVTGLEAHASSGSVVATTYNLIGVIEALSAGSVDVVEAVDFLRACDLGHHEDAQIEKCQADRWVALMGRLGLPMRAIIPSFRGGNYERSDLYDPSFKAAAKRLGLTLSAESQLDWHGTPMLTVYRVARP